MVLPSHRDSFEEDDTMVCFLIDEQKKTKKFFWG